MLQSLPKDHYFFDQCPELKNLHNFNCILIGFQYFQRNTAIFQEKEVGIKRPEREAETADDFGSSSYPQVYGYSS